MTWFKVRAADPLTRGRMIYTFDDGPWLGTEKKPASQITVLAQKPLSETLEIQLCRTNEGKWCLRGLELDNPIWVRILEHVPGDFFKFTGQAPTDLGWYGWKVHMTFGEYTHVYLDRDGQFLFYFTSW